MGVLAPCLALLFCALEDRRRIIVETAAAGGGTERCTSTDWSRRCWEP